MTADSPAPGGAFSTTQWTQVLAARTESPAARAALSDLCAAYYAPVHSYIARTTRDLGEARDLTHSFFERLLTGTQLASVQRDQGRFRSYLLGAVKHFLADTRDRQSAAKRGASHPHLPVDQASAGPSADTHPGIDPPDAHALPPDAWFDRQWALTLISRSLDALAAEYDVAGKAEHFALLKPWLTGDRPELSQAQTARQLGLSEAALKISLHRLRHRFRDEIKHHITATLEHPGDAEDELQSLMRAL
jgi:RNA polymerase sigma-70 factor (ECF subfamily)